MLIKVKNYLRGLFLHQSTFFKPLGEKHSGKKFFFDPPYWAAPDISSLTTLLIFYQKRKVSFEFNSSSITVFDHPRAVVATLSISCAPDQYGPLCSIRCVPPNDRHACDEVTGKIKCAEAWSGRNCNQNGRVYESITYRCELSSFGLNLFLTLLDSKGTQICSCLVKSCFLFSIMVLIIARQITHGSLEIAE